MREIPITQGKFVIVDDDDYEWLSQWKWCHQSQGYAMRRMYAPGNSKGTPVYMHRFICGAPDGCEVDHINRNRLDNRRANLRLASQNQNQSNRRVTIGTSRFKGVSICGKRWRAYIKVNYQYIHLGVFATEIDAAKAYDTAARLHFGEYAHTNFDQEV